MLGEWGRWGVEPRTGGSGSGRVRGDECCCANAPSKPPRPHSRMVRRSCSAYKIPNFRLHPGSLLRLVWVLREPILSKTVFLIRGPIVRLRAEGPTLQTWVDSHSGHPGAQGRVGKDFFQRCGPILGTGPGGCLRRGGGTRPPCGPPEALVLLKSSLVCCQAPHPQPPILL